MEVSLKGSINEHLQLWKKADDDESEIFVS